MRKVLVAISALVAASTLFAGCSPATNDEQPSPSPSQSQSPTTPTPTSSPDPWAGHFDETALDGRGDYDPQFWGSFGDPGGVGVVQNEDQRIDAGAYVVEVQCAGAPEVLALFSDLEGEPVTEPVAVPCPGSVAVDVELTKVGVTMVLDSQSEPGAYLVRFTRRG